MTLILVPRTELEPVRANAPWDFARFSGAKGASGVAKIIFNNWYREPDLNRYVLMDTRF